MTPKSCSIASLIGVVNDFACICPHIWIYVQVWMYVQSKPLFSNWYNNFWPDIRPARIGSLICFLRWSIVDTER